MVELTGKEARLGKHQGCGASIEEGVCQSASVGRELSQGCQSWMRSFESTEGLSSWVES